MISPNSSKSTYKSNQQSVIPGSSYPGRKRVPVVVPPKAPAAANIVRADSARGYYANQTNPPRQATKPAAVRPAAVAPPKAQPPVKVDLQWEQLRRQHAAQKAAAEAAPVTPVTPVEPPKAPPAIKPADLPPRKPLTIIEETIKEEDDRFRASVAAIIEAAEDVSDSLEQAIDDIDQGD